MTSRSPYTAEKRRSRDSQERHAFDEYKANKDGERPTLKVTGNKTKEEIQVEIPIGMFSYPAKSTDLEVIANGHGDDPHNKLGRMTQPEGSRYKPKSGEHGMQDPSNKDERIYFTPDGQILTGKKGIGITNDKDIKATSSNGDFRATATDGVASAKGKKAASVVSGNASIEVRDGVVYVRGKIVFEQPATVGSCPEPL